MKSQKVKGKRQNHNSKGKILNFTLWFYLLPFEFCLSAMDSAFAKEEPLTDAEVVVKTEGAHRLLLPKDWPVEHKDGRIAPVPIEEYLSLKFDQVRDGFAAMDRRLERIERRLQQIEEDQRAFEQRMRFLEERIQQQEVTHGDATTNR